MSEYKAVKANGNMDYVASPDGELLLFLPQEHNAVAVATILNEEMAAYAERITGLQIENARIAELEAALEQIQYTVNHVHCMQIAAAALKKAGGNE